METMKTGVIGLGNMGMGMAKNLVATDFPVYGFDLSDAKRQELTEYGGQAVASVREVGKNTDIAFVMVVNEQLVSQVLHGKDGLLESMSPGSVIVITATIGSAAAKRFAEDAESVGLSFIDCPVSGGPKGADTGTLTLMASGDSQVFTRYKNVFDAISKCIYYVGEEPGKGQIVKSCMQGMVGCIYSGIFEMLVLGNKAGIDTKTLYDVIGNSVANTTLFQIVVPTIMERQFSGTGSNIQNTYKDLNITLNMAQEVGVPMMITGAAKQFFQAGMTKFPEEDNQCLVKVLEDITGIQV